MKRRIVSILLACALVCLPVSQAAAAGTIDVSAGVSEQLLFPGDSMTGVGLPVMKAGDEIAQEMPDGIWTNTDTESGTVYSASVNDDWTAIVLTEVGRVLVVENGTSSIGDGSEDAKHHYSYPEEADSEVPQDTAYYAEYDTVKIKAADPADGKEFAGWESDSSEVVFADASSAETTITMPAAKATVRATYRDAVQEETQAAEEEGGEVLTDIGDDGSAEDVEVLTDIGDDGSAEDVEVLTDIGDDGSSDEGEVLTDIVIDAEPVQEENVAEITLDAPAEASAEEVPEEVPATQYTLTVNEGTGSGTYDPGTWVEVTANDYSEANLQFNGWFVESMNTTLDDLNAMNTGLVMPEADVILTATYTEIQPQESEETESAGEEAQTEDVQAQPLQADAEQPESEPIQSETVLTESETVQSETVLTESEPIQSETVLTESEPIQSETVQTESETVQSETQQSETAQTVTEQMTEAVLAGENDDTATPQSETQPETVAPEVRYTVTVANAVLSGSADDAAATTDSSTWTVKENKSVTITANPNPSGQAFAGWKITDAQGADVNPADIGIADATSSTITAVVSKNLNFAALYEGIQYKVVVNDGEANYETAVSGTVVTITADEAPEGMEFDYWKVDAGNVSLTDALSETTSFTMSTADVTVSAYYKLKEYRLTVENGSGSQEYFHMGDAVTVSSNYPASGKEFDAWVAVSGNVTFTDASRWQTTFTMPASDVSVKATYKNGPSADSNTILDLVAGGEYYADDTIKFTASGAGMDNTNPNPGDYRYRPTGYQIGNVTGSWTSSPYTTSMSIKATGEYTLKVTYAKDVYDGSSWVADGTTDTKSVTFRVIQKAAGVATGDDTPIAIVIAIAGVSCVLFILLLVLFIRRRKAR
jgi:hypothetical protein